MIYKSRDFVRATQARFLLGDPQDTFQGISIDTRTLRPDDLFIAIRGPHHDGHDHLKRAVEKGAAGCVVEQLDPRMDFDRSRPPFILHVAHSVSALQQWGAYLRKRSSAYVVGLTGSNGKTTTKEMIASILGRAGKTLATQGNLNNYLGVPLTLSRLEPEHRYAVIEMGTSQPGDIALVAGLAAPSIGLITNIGSAHLEKLGSREGILQEKKALWDVLLTEGVAIINQDDPLLAGAANTLKCRKLFFGLKALADVRAEDIQMEGESTSFQLIVNGQKNSVRIPVTGQFQVMNALAAAAVGHALSIPLKDIAEGLSSFQPMAMRMQKMVHSSGAVLINDAYNANPSSVRASITTLCQTPTQHPRWLVLGDMRELGARARAEHQELGTWIATQPLDRVFLYGRDTRFLFEALKVQSGPMKVERFRKKRLLLAELERSLQEKPIVLFKGSRVMRLEQIIHPLMGIEVRAGAH